MLKVANRDILDLPEAPAMPRQSDIAATADFTAIRYAQCWEDADILLEALDIQPGDSCFSIASAGDNTLAMLSRAPGHILALDLSPAQLACLELRVAAYRELEHDELLELMGSVASTRREDLYRRCRSQLSPNVRAFWDAQPNLIRAGIGGAGKFERYFALFRRRVLPLVESQRNVRHLLAGGSLEERRAFYAQQWNGWRWQLMFRLFFSRFVLGRLGRDPQFFSYVEGSVAERILQRVEHALIDLDPAENPYIQWILLGRHGSALPYALRPENFAAIRANLDRLEWRCQSLEAFLASAERRSIDRFNLSDIFEYVSFEQYTRLLERIAEVGREGARLAYWNMLAPRSRPAELAERLHAHTDLAHYLHSQDKACFYSAFVVEEVRA